MPPPVAPTAEASALFLSPWSFASILTRPVLEMEAVDPTSASTSAPSSTLAVANAPVTPITATFATIAVASATFSPIACTVTESEARDVAVEPRARGAVDQSRTAPSR